jgi:hypothetical protein
MVINFLSQIVLFMLFMMVVHGCWVYVQDNARKKKIEIVTPSQIEKYEKMIDELQQSHSQSIDQPTTTEQEEELGDFVNSLL